MKKIALHNMDLPETVRTTYEWKVEDVEEGKVSAKKEFKFLFFLYQDVLTIIRLNRVFNEDYAREKAYFRLGLNAIAEVSRLAHFPGKVMEAVIDDAGPFDILVEDLKEIDDDWFNSFYLAVIARDAERLKHILSLPIELLKLTSGTPATDYSNLLLKLRMTFFGEQVFDTKLYNELKAMEAAHADLVKADASQHNIFVIFINRYNIEAMKCLSEADEAGFNQHLLNALEAHQAFWGQKKPVNPGGPPLCIDNRGYISFPCTALAALAYDKGWTLAVESDYMPPYMVDGSIMD